MRFDGLLCESLFQAILIETARRTPLSSQPRKTAVGGFAPAQYDYSGVLGRCGSSREPL